MSGLEMLEKHPLTASVIKEWLLEKMITSLESKSVPDDFKEIMRKEGIQNNRVAELIDANPRFLFDVFDKNNIVIETFYSVEEYFTSKIENEKSSKLFKTRKECDLWGINLAFNLLEKKFIETNKI